MSDDRKHFITAAELESVIVEQGSKLRAHPLPRSRPLSHAAGMERLIVSENRLPSGRKLADPDAGGERFLYVLQGRGNLQVPGLPVPGLQVPGETVELGVGDFIGLSATEPAYQLSNPFAEDLVYLQGRVNHTGTEDDDL